MLHLPRTRSALKWTLVAGCLIGYLAVLPYVLHSMADGLAEASLPVPVLIALQFAVAGIVYYGVISVALRLLPATPYRLLLDPEASPSPDGGAWKQALLWGVYGAIATIVAFALGDAVTRPFVGVLPEAITEGPPMWKGALASLYGGITEEVLLRLFVMTGLTALGLRLPFLKERPGLVVWIALVLAAFVFALAHVPAAFSLGVPVGPGLILRILLLNSLGGVIFGWLFAKRNFETAVIAHALTDIVVHVVIPALS